MDLGLKDVHVLVTGASGGIGLAIVKCFLEQGAQVTAHFNTNKSTLVPIESGNPGRVQALQADLAKEANVKDLFERSEGAFGTVQVLIINHGIFKEASVDIADMELDQWTHTLSSNLTSSFLVAREYLRRLRNAASEAKENAAIVLVGSTSGKYGEPGHGDYASSKSAMMYGLTLTLKNEIVKIAPRGRVNSVGPGWVRTPMAEKSLQDPNIVYKALATTPLKKVAVPEDVAYQTVLLSSRKVNGHVSGQVVMIEGGMEGRLLNSPADVGL